MLRRRRGSNRKSEPTYWSRGTALLDNTVALNLTSISLFLPANIGPTFNQAAGIDTEVTVRAMRVNMYPTMNLTANTAFEAQASCFYGIYAGPSLTTGLAIPNPGFAGAADQSVDWLHLGMMLSDRFVAGQLLVPFTSAPYCTKEINLKGLRRLKSGDGIYLSMIWGLFVAGGGVATLAHQSLTLQVSTLWQRSLPR